MPAATPVACPQCSAPHDGREMLYTAPLKRRCAACQHVFEDPESRRDFDARMRGTRTPTLEVSPEAVVYRAFTATGRELDAFRLTKGADGVARVETLAVAK